MMRSARLVVGNESFHMPSRFMFQFFDILSCQVRVSGFSCVLSAMMYGVPLSLMRVDVTSSYHWL